MMAGCAKRSDRKIDVLGAPTSLGQSEKRQKKQRRADVENEVTPAAQDPQIAFRVAFRYRRDSLRASERGNYLHERSQVFVSLNKKSTFSPGPITCYR